MRSWRSGVSYICSSLALQQIGVYWAGITAFALCHDMAITSCYFAMPRRVWSFPILTITCSQQRSRFGRWNSSTDSVHRTPISLRRLGSFQHSVLPMNSHFSLLGEVSVPRLFSYINVSSIKGTSTCAAKCECARNTPQTKSLWYNLCL